MSRENETYRLHLEDLFGFFGEKRILSVKDVATYTGKSLNWCREHLHVDKNGITVVKLANELSKM